MLKDKALATASLSELLTLLSRNQRVNAQLVLQLERFNTAELSVLFHVNQVVLEWLNNLVRLMRS